MSVTEDEPSPDSMGRRSSNSSLSRAGSAFQHVSTGGLHMRKVEHCSIPTGTSSSGGTRGHASRRLAVFVALLGWPLLAASSVQAQCTTTIPAGNVVHKTWTAAGSPYCV